VSRVRRAAAGAATSYVQFGLQILLQFLLAPLVLRYAGQETLGAYSIVGQVVGYLGLLDLGFSATFNRYLGHATGVDDQGARFNNVLVTGKTFLLGTNAIAGAACFVLAIGIGPMLHLSSAVATDARLGLAVMGVWSIARTPFVVSGSALVASQDLAFRNILTAVANALRLLLSLLAVWLGFGLFGLMLAGVAADVIDGVACRFRFRHLHPGCGRGWGVPDKPLFREMLGFGRDALMINIGVRLALSTDQIVIGTLRGAVASSIYYATQMPAVLGWQALMRLADAAAPAITQLHAQNVHESLKHSFLRIHRYTLVFSLLFAIGFIGFNGTFVSLWVGPEQFGGLPLTILLAIFAVMISFSHVSNTYVVARGEIQTAARLALLEGALNLALSILLGWRFGLSGVMGATVLCHLIGLTYVQVASHKALRVGAWPFIRIAIMPAIWPALVSTAVMFGMWRWVEFHSWPRLLACMAILVAVHLLAALVLSTDSQDRTWLRAVQRRLTFRRA
jgi:O-antigen/teichoic acid export membrane protein